ncbi:MAG: hypothetical protein ACO21B_04665, partial [Gemmobacter sp.]
IAQGQGALAASHENADTAKFNISGTLTQGTLGLTDYRVTATAPRAGTLRRILIEDGTPVEYGAPLMIID